MSFATSSLTHALATVAQPGVSVVPTRPVPDNCHTILVSNPSDATNDGVVGQGSPGGALVPGDSGRRVEPGMTVVLALGTTANRGVMNQDVRAGSGLVYDGVGGSVTLEISYVSVVGGGQ